MAYFHPQRHKVKKFASQFICPLNKFTQASLLFQMALQLLPLLQIIIIFCTPGYLSYPTHETKRYGRTSNRYTYDSHPYVSYPYQTMTRAQNHPLNYYKLYPYSQNYPEDYFYPQETYPAYYPAPRTSKYEVYQAVLPYYYQDRPVARPGYGYYGYGDPVVDLQEEIQEAEREEREEAQPIGHESYYENDDNTGEGELDDANAAFLQNLILSQMYQDSVDNDKASDDSFGYNDYDGTYGKFDEAVYKPPSYATEDEDVRELKQLTKQQNRQQQFRNQNKNDDIHWFDHGNFRKQNKNEFKRSDVEANRIPESYMGAVVYSERKPVVKLTTSTTESPKSTETPKRDARGQKEEFQMRPATPVRHPFTGPVLAMMSKNEAEKKRTPSVYDTIKHMLDMEKSLENSQMASEVRPSMKKRIITPEESLTRQLTVLKKAQ
ncbi:hypothetical protein NQ317_003508 [Molorchus minor]|uniref:Uncharacterized protein n=1 Tax=Molorchus minor TaxID=1323400 RepID=A0ABQ9K164_9CUCU|nr:hypothetical protein NQ317_003508 [Molorchus minor]